MLNSPQGAKIPGPTLSSVKALVFDTFGTVVDWRSSIAKEVDLIDLELGVLARVQ